ncbi:cytochrome P450 [Byssothecium circinans]|uniref:Cytochrome P450 n=1 Tax=Byssothecium circinans TaxID=147558 RepID=A0A6A5U7P6_9PLEO|nr:cytochrome P450 [Byssothecium circinans]
MFVTALIIVLLSFLIVYSSFRVRVPESWQFLMKGRRMLIARSIESKGGPFSIHIPGNRLHLVCSKEHWNDLNSTSISHLSMHAWSKEHFQPKYAFGYVWPDRREEDGMPVVRAIRTVTNQFAVLKPKFITIMRDELDEALKLNAQQDGTSKIALWDTVKHFASRMNVLIMFGDDVANNPEFVDRGLKYIDEATLVAEAAKSFPAFLVPVLAKFIRGRNRNQQYILQAIASEVKKHRAYEDTVDRPGSIVEGLVRNNPDLTDSRLELDMNSTFIASTTSTPIIATHLIQDIFTHQEYLPALRTELKGVLDDPIPDLRKLPLLEGFLVESMRTHCFLSTVIHRVSLRPFTFHDGYTVPKGEVVEFYQYNTMNDESIYADAAKFDPERHCRTARVATDMGVEWPFWGNSKIACPGRFHVSNVAKLIAIYFIMKFDCEFESTEGLNFEFRDVLVPSPNAKLIMRRRE